MRVVSWNIELGRDIDGAIDGLTSRDELEGFDALLVQEMSPESVASLAERLASRYVYAPTGVHRKTGLPFGNAVLTPHEILDERSVQLPHQAFVAGFDRGTVGAAFEVAGTIVWCYSVHTEMPLILPRRRREQIQRLVGEVSAHGTPVIVGGDFNTASRPSKIDLEGIMSTGGFDRLTPRDQATLRRFRMRFSLDHLFGRDVAPVHSGISLGHRASDHYPIHADLKLNPRSRLDRR